MELVVYVPLAQFPQQDVNLVVRTQRDPLALMAGIREAVREVDPHLPLGNVRTMEQVKERSMLWAKQPTWVVGAFAGIAALMAALGLYGVLAHAVTEQRREIGIRMALGARRGDVVSHTLRGALSMILVGLAVGLAGAFAVTRALKSLLFEVSALDPVALAVACVLMALVGIVAALIPASRAAGVDPMTVLREEGEGRQSCYIFTRGDFPRGCGRFMDDEQPVVSATKESDGATRRELFQIGNALLWPVLLGASAAKGATSGPLTPGPEIYQSIGVEPVINCRGTFTIIGASVETAGDPRGDGVRGPVFRAVRRVGRRRGTAPGRIDRRRVGDGLGRLRRGAEARDSRLCRGRES